MTYGSTSRRHRSGAPKLPPPRHAPTVEPTPNTLSVNVVRYTNVHFTLLTYFVDGVNARLCVAILRSIVECQRTD